jgi:hypothetical protein
MCVRSCVSRYVIGAAHTGQFSGIFGSSEATASICPNDGCTALEPLIVTFDIERLVQFVRHFTAGTERRLRDGSTANRNSSRSMPSCAASARMPSGVRNADMLLTERSGCVNAFLARSRPSSANVFRRLLWSTVAGSTQNRHPTHPPLRLMPRKSRADRSPTLETLRPAFEILC